MSLTITTARAATALGTGVLLMALTACAGGAGPASAGSASGASTSGTAVSGSLAGAGASSQEAAMEAWKAGFQAANPDATVSYDAVGSGAGITQFTDGQVAWAGSDAPLKDEEIAAANQRCGGPAWALPVYISPVAVVFNLEGVTALNLDAATIAKIFSGKITKWNDPAIVAANPGVTLPDLAITPVHRSDESGTTENFTEYLASAAPADWTSKPGKAWPLEGGESADKTAGVVQAVTAGKGTIGYADASQAGNLGIVALQAKDGTFVTLSPETAAAAADTAEPMSGRESNDIAVEVNRIPETNNSYPLVMISYSIVCSTYSDPAQAALVKAFIGYQVSEEGQNTAAQNAGSAPLSGDMRSKVQAALDAIK